MLAATAAAAAAVVVAAASSVPGALAYWQPAPGTTWEWQLSDQPYNYSMTVDAIDLDLDGLGNDAAATGHGKGMKVICYINVGSIESSRSDASSFPASVVGNEYPGWPDEKFLDIRAQAVRDVMTTRFTTAAGQGCDAIEPDNTDSYTNGADVVGFDLTEDDAVNYLTFLSGLAHGLGMGIGLKNNGDLIDSRGSAIVDLHEFAVVEQCYGNSNCGQYKPFVEAGKAVFDAEYTDAGSSGGCGDGTVTLSQMATVCAAFALGTDGEGMSAIIKTCDLGPEFHACAVSTSAGSSSGSSSSSASAAADFANSASSSGAAATTAATSSSSSSAYAGATTAASSSSSAAASTYGGSAAASVAASISTTAAVLASASASKSSTVPAAAAQSTTAAAASASVGSSSLPTVTVTVVSTASASKCAPRTTTVTYRSGGRYGRRN